MHRLGDHEGRPIRLTEERLSHILAHPEMVGMEDAIAEGLTSPERVIESPSDSAVRLYYRRFPATRVGDKFLCVVVKIQTGDAFVITAYLTDRMRRGRVLWERNR